MITFTKDAFLLVQCTRLEGVPLELAIAQIARGGGRTRVVQRSRTLGMFGMSGLSRMDHELDAVIVGSDWLGLVEVKSSINGVTKSDLFVFDGKTQDFYVNRILRGQGGPHFRFLISTQPLRPILAAFAMERAIITIEPDLIPIPLLLGMTAESDGGDLAYTDAGGCLDSLHSAIGPMESVSRVTGNWVQTRVSADGANTARHARSVHKTWSARILPWLERSNWVDIHWRSVRARLDPLGLIDCA